MQKKLQILFSMLFLMCFAYSAKAQVDITDQYLTNADLSTVDAGWTYYSDAYKYEGWREGNDDLSAAVEFYAGWGSLEHTNFKFSQTITLPAGDYRIAVNAFFREGNDGNGTNANKAWIFAGEKKQNVYALLNMGDLSTWASAGDDMNKAMAAFKTGAFSNAFDFSLAEETEIEVGFQGLFDAIRQWCILGPVKLYKYSLEDYLVDYRLKVAEAQAVEGKMGAAEAQALQDAIKDESEFNLGSEVAAAISALTEAIDAANLSIQNYKTLGELLAQEEAIKANTSDEDAKAAYDAAVADVVAAYEAGTVEDFDVAASTVKAALNELAKTQTAPGSDLTAFIVNPEINGADGWTIERPVGGNGPLLNNTSFEYWAGNANPRTEAQFDYYQVITGLPNGLYTISADMYNSLNGEGGDYTEFAPTCGLYAAAGEAEVVKLVEEDGTALNTYTTENITVTDGTLRIGVKSISPLAARWFVADNFKLTLVKAISDEEITYYAALAAINDGETYRIFTEVEGTKYFMNATGYLVADSQEAATFTFDKVVANGTLYEAGWNLGCKFTNPSLTNGSSGDVANDGHIHVGTNDRNDWERQVFFLNDEGKFAVRSTNANSANWGANTYWDVFSETLPEAGYSLNPAYVWQLAGFVDLTELNALADKLEAQVAATDTYDDPEGAVSVISAAIEAIRNADYTSKKEADAAIAQLDELAQQFFGAIQPKTAIDVTDWYIVNPEPMNIKGWEGTAFGDASDGVCEYWNKAAADFHQTINIPAGLYRLTAIALTRTGMVGKIYAGENSVNIVTVGSDIVNRRAQAASWFAAGNGVNTVYFEMAEAGPITIGLTADETTADYWTVWKNFKLEMVADFPADVTYNLVSGDEILATETVTQLPGDEVAVPASFKDLMHGLYSFEADVDVIAKETTTVNVTPVWAGPFEFSTDAENAKWYNMDIRGGWTVSKCETEPYTMKNNATDLELLSDEFQWAFAPVEGDPLKVVILNKAAEGMSLTPEEVPDGEGTRYAVVLREGEYAWEIFANGDGFVLREVGTDNNWVNQAGGGNANAPLAFWNSSAGRSDGGSTLRVTELPDAAEVYLAALEDAIVKADAVVDAKENVGDGLFQIPESALFGYAIEIDAAKEVAAKEEVTAEELKAALEALATATANYAAVPVTAPSAGVAYTFQQKASGWYLSLYSETVEEETKTGVRLSEEPMPFTFVEAEGGYYLQSGDLFVGIAAGSDWKSSALEADKAVITAKPIVITEGEDEDVVTSLFYTLAEAKGLIGSNDPDSEGYPNCYVNKEQSDYSLFTIAEYVEPIPDVVLNAPAFSAEEGTQAEPNIINEPLKVTFTADNLEENGLNADDLQVKIQVVVTGDLPENIGNMSSETAHRVMGETFSIPLGETEFPVPLKDGYVYQNIAIVSATLVKPAKDATEEEPAVEEEVIASYAGAPVQLHWVGFEDGSLDACYDRAMAAIVDGANYRIVTEVNGTKFYVTEEGKLTSAVENGGIFLFTKTAGGAFKSEGFQINGATKRFTNPPLSNDVANLTPGAFATSTNNRAEWETQVLFLAGGKYAIRSCNTAHGTSSWADAGRTFWTWGIENVENDATPMYTYDPTYVWQLEAVVPINVTYELYDAGGDVMISSVTKKQEANSEISIPAEWTTNFAYQFEAFGEIGEENCTIEVERSFKPGVVHALADLSNAKAYTIRCDRGALLTKDGYMASTAHSSLTNAEAADFAVISYEDHLYLYSVADQKFVTNTGALSDMPTHGVEDAIVMTAQTDPYFLYNFNTANSYLNTNGNDPYGYVINQYSTPDAGNQYYMIATSDFDPTAALAALEAYFHPSYFVTYVVNDAQGNVLFTSEAVPTQKGAKITTLPTDFQRPFTTYNEVDVTIADTETTVEFIATTTFPFEVSTSFDEAKWYNMTIRTNYYVAMDETEPYYPKADKDLTAAASQWAFTGDAYNGIVLWNKAAGEGFALTKDGSNVVMREGAYAWEIFANNDGFVLREKGSDNNWINQNGGSNGPLQFWNSANGKTDDGSTFRVSEVVIPEVLFSVLPNIESGVQEEAGESTGFTNVELGTEFKLTITAENLEVNGLNPDDLTISINMVMEAAFDSPAWAMGNDEETGLPHSTRYVAQGLSFSYAEEITLEDVVFGEDYPYIQNINIVGISLMNGDEVVATIAEPVAVRFLVVTKDGIPVGIKSLNSALQNADIYDMAGRKVQKVQRGNVYIINGKKVAVK